MPDATRKQQFSWCLFSSLIQSPQRLLRVDAFANAVHIEGIVPAVLGEGTVAMRAEAAAIALSTPHVDAQARMLIRVERAEIQIAPSPWSGSIKADDILDVVSLIVSRDSDSFAVSLPNWPGFQLGGG